ncbi:hypothetical protein B0H10DRAFT_1828236, partial [Mycena sp. CBHHK59/15]
TCTLWSFLPNTAMLAASCAEIDGSYHYTTIEISQCVGNQNSNLGCQVKWESAGSCVFYSIDVALGSFFTIAAHCTTDNGGIETSENFDMSEDFIPFHIQYTSAYQQ